MNVVDTFYHALSYHLCTFFMSFSCYAIKFAYMEKMRNFLVKLVEI